MLKQERRHPTQNFARVKEVNIICGTRGSILEDINEVGVKQLGRECVNCMQLIGDREQWLSLVTQTENICL